MSFYVSSLLYDTTVFFGDVIYLGLYELLNSLKVVTGLNPIHVM